jgi:sensor domain CHASE-containing protein
MSSCTEWASWDATSNCLRGAHWEFERRGLVVPQFRQPRYRRFVLLDTDGQIVLSRGFDAQNAEFTDPSPELLDLVQTPQFRARAAAGASGIVTLQGETLLVAAYPHRRRKKR